MAIQDIQDGKGVALLDPHGDTAEKILSFVPARRTNDVIYFNPADMQFPIAYNPMDSCPEEKRFLVVSNMVKVFHRIWADSWGPQLEDILRHTLMAIMETEHPSLLCVQRMLDDDAYREQVAEKIKDPFVRHFWLERFPKILKRDKDPVASNLNKIGQFLTVFLMRNILGQNKSSFNLREVMDKQKILICNLSKGRIGADNSALLGAMLIIQLSLAAMERQDMPEEERKDFYVFVDEFQNFATDSFADILSEARKYRLNLILAHQFIDQLDFRGSTLLRDAIIGNVGTFIVFRVGSTDAEFLENEFSPEFNITDLVNLGFGQVYIKLSIDGFTSRPFSANTFPPLNPLSENRLEKDNPGFAGALFPAPRGSRGENYKMG